MTALEAALHAMELTAKDHQARGIAYPTESYRELQKFRATVNESGPTTAPGFPPVITPISTSSLGHGANPAVTRTEAAGACP